MSSISSAFSSGIVSSTSYLCFLCYVSVGGEPIGQVCVGHDHCPFGAFYGQMNKTLLCYPFHLTKHVLSVSYVWSL